MKCRILHPLNLFLRVPRSLPISRPMPSVADPRELPRNDLSYLHQQQRVFVTQAGSRLVIAVRHRLKWVPHAAFSVTEYVIVMEGFPNIQ
jgi:hypothetical protein